MSNPGDQPFSYDAVPYPTHPYPQTHPDRLATVAALFGMRPQPIDDCSLLEIGCAQGGNIGRGRRVSRRVRVLARRRVPELH